MVAQPTWAGLGFDCPVYLRKVPRKNVLGTPATALDQRVAAVAGSVFLCDPKPYSLFLVGSDDELRRVTVGYSGGRTSLRAEIDWSPLRPDELEAIGIAACPTHGETRCHFTNTRHPDLPAEDEHLLRLCHLLVEAGRRVVTPTKGQLTSWVETALARVAWQTRPRHDATRTSVAASN